MKKRLCLIVAIALVWAAIAACGDDSTTTQPQSIEPAPTVEPTSAPTAVPTAEPTATPEPTATSVPTPEPTAAPTATAVPEPAPDVGGVFLSDDCLPGGVLDSAVTVLSCSIQALQQVRSFSFEGEVDLLSLFATNGGDDGEGAFRISGIVMQPDKLRFSLSMEVDNEKIQINGMMIGSDAFVQDPESGEWYKGIPPDEDFLGSIQLAGMLQFPNDPDATLKETVELEDGTMGYVIVSDQTGPQGGMDGLGFPGGKLTWTVGIDDFLTREVKVSVEGLGEKPLDLMSMSYSGYNEEYEIEPPAEYSELPDEAMLSEPPPGVATVMSLTKNDDGDVEVVFDRPVRVQGTVELYVLEPQTGGWGLPLLGRSGTDTLIFDADAEGNPALIVGESQIAGFTFPDQESKLTDLDGTSVNYNIEPWTYE